MRVKETFPRSTKPHWKTPASSKKMLRQSFFALMPVLFIGFIRNAPATFWLMLVGIIVGIIFKFLLSAFSRRKNWFDENTIHACALFSCLVPFGIPFPALTIGIFFMVVVAEECFGGRGQNIFNPVLAGFITVNLLFSDQLSFCYENFGSILISTDPKQGAVILEIVLLGCGGLFLIFRKLIAWQIPFFYLVPHVFTMFFFQNSVAAKLPMVPVLFSAFFLVTDYASSPISLRGRIIFASGCGLLFVAFSEWLAGFDAIGCAILFMNSISPLIDRYLSAITLPFSRQVKKRTDVAA